MRWLLAVPLFLGGAFGLLAQDRVYLLNGDTLTGTIGTVRPNKVYLQELEAGRRRSKVVPVQDIRAYQRAGHTLVEVNGNSAFTGIDAPDRSLGGKGWRLGLSGGHCRRTARSPDDVLPELAEHFKGLRPGWYMRATSIYMTSPKFGIGLLADRSWYRHRTEDITLTDPSGNTLSGPWDERIGIDLIGPAVVLSTDPANGGPHFSVLLSAGATRYANDAIIFDGPVNLEGWSVGFASEVQVLLPVGRRSALTVNGGFSGGVVNTFDHSGAEGSRTQVLPGGSGEGLGMITLGVGLLLMP